MSAKAQSAEQLAVLESHIETLTTELERSRLRITELEGELAMERAALAEEVARVEARCQWAMSRTACLDPNNEASSEAEDVGGLAALYSTMRPSHVAMLKRDLAAGFEVETALANPRLRIYPQSLRAALKRGLCVEMPGQCP